MSKRAVRRKINKFQFSQMVESLENRMLMASWSYVLTSDPLLTANTTVPSTGPSGNDSYSLRSLIYYYNNTYNGEANQPFTIELSNTTYTLSATTDESNIWGGRLENSDEYGDLDINPIYTTAPLIITGPAGGNATINCAGGTGSNGISFGLDRLFQVISGNLQLANLTLQWGEALDNGELSKESSSLGGGVFVNPGASLSLSNCVVSSNQAGSALLTNYSDATGLNAAGGGVYGSGGSTISINNGTTFINNSVIAGKGGKSGSTGLSGGNAYGAGLAVAAPIPDPITNNYSVNGPVISFSADSGVNAIFTSNRLNSFLNYTGEVVDSGGTGGSGSGEGGAGGNAYGAGMYIGSGQLNIDGGAAKSPIQFTDNQARGGTGYSTKTDQAGANGTAYGAGVYLTPGQLSVANGTASTGILQFSGNQAGNASSSLYYPTVQTGDAGYTSANGAWTLRTAVAALNPLAATGMNLELNLPAGNISLVASGSGNNAGSIAISNTGAGSLTIMGASPSSSVINGGGLGNSIFSLSNSDVSFSNLTITGANTSGYGGAIAQASGATTLNNVTLSYNKAANGGGYYSYGGQLVIIGGYVIGNTAPSGSGAGLFLNGGMTATINGVNISNNSASTSSGWGGGIFQDSGGSLNIKNNTKIQNNSAGSGAGLYVSGSVDITGSKISNNNAGSIGGGMVITTGGNVNLSNVSVVSNKVVSGTTPTGSGGGIYQGNATLNLKGSTVFKKNSASDGGGIFSANSTLKAKGTGFISNTAGSSGGGLCMSNGGTATLNSVAFSSNGATGSNSNGGGIFQTGGTLNIGGNSTLSKNSAQNGGGLYAESGKTQMNGGQILKNTANGTGAGICSWGNSITLKNMLVESNINNATSSSGGYGGGIYQGNGGGLSLANLTVRNNSASEMGGGIYSGSNITATNSLISKNSANVSGAGIYLNNPNGVNEFSSVSVDSNSLSGTTASSGGGMYVSGGLINASSLNVVNNSISGSNATIYGAGIYATNANVSFNSGYNYINNNTLKSSLEALGGGLYLTNGAVLNQNSGLAFSNNNITCSPNGTAGTGVGGGIAFGPSSSWTGTIPQLSLNIPNFGFESPSYPNSFYYNPSNANWTFSGTSGTSGFGGSGISGNDSGFTSANPNAPQGTQVAFLQMNCTLSQSISGFYEGQKYTLSFEAAQRKGCPDQSVSVSIGGQNLGTFIPTSTNYQSFSYAFTSPTTGNLTLNFTGLNPNNTDETVFLDNVSIKASTFSGNSASAGGNDIAFNVANTTDSTTSATSGAAGIDFFTSGSGSLRSAVTYAQNWMNGGGTSPSSMAIMLSSSTTNYALTTAQQITVSVPTSQELTIIGTSGTATIQGWYNRTLYVEGSGSLVLQNVDICGGDVTAPTNAQGGGIYQASGTVTLNNVTMYGNVVTATQAGSSGTNGGQGDNGGAGGTGGNAYGGAYYLSGGTLNLMSSAIIGSSTASWNNSVKGANGGSGGSGGGGGCEHTGWSGCKDQIDGGAGGNGGNGGVALGGGIYQAGGTINSPSGWNNISSIYNSATGGSGGSGGAGTSGAPSGDVCKWSGKSGGASGNPGTAAAAYSYDGGNRVFTSNATANAQSVKASGMMMSGGTLNASIRATASNLKGARNITLELHAADGSLIATTTTDGNGYYRFNTDFSGLGYIQLASKTVFQVAPQGTNAGSGHTSNFNPQTLRSDTVQFLAGVPLNQHVDLILNPLATALKTSHGTVTLVNASDGATIWQTKVLPNCYKGGFTVSTIDFNADNTPDYIMIPRSWAAKPIFVDGRTGTAIQMANEVSHNLRNGFTVLPFNFTNQPVTTQWVFAPSNNRPGRVAMVDYQARKVLWNATDIVLGQMNVSTAIANYQTAGVYGSTPSVFLTSTKRFNYKFEKVLDGKSGKVIQIDEKLVNDPVLINHWKNLLTHKAKPIA